jgi:hypothetical protein
MNSHRQISNVRPPINKRNKKIYLENRGLETNRKNDLEDRKNEIPYFAKNFIGPSFLVLSSVFFLKSSISDIICHIS